MKQKTVKVRGKSYRVPVDGDGLVPTDHIMGIQSKRSSRSRTVDGKRRAKITFPSRPEPEQAVLWRLHPGKYDIKGVDAPVVPVIVDEDVKEEVISAIESLKPQKPKRRKADPGKDYSASTWRRKVDFDTDPEAASREAARLLRAEREDATEEMRSYLDDSRYDEFGSTRYRHDDRDLVNDFYSKMWDEFRMNEGYMNVKSRKARR